MKKAARDHLAAFCLSGIDFYQDFIFQNELEIIRRNDFTIGAVC
jgi:hypothetical protein